jgi:uncharacterized protein
MVDLPSDLIDNEATGVLRRPASTSHDVALSPLRLDPSQSNKQPRLAPRVREARADEITPALELLEGGMSARVRLTMHCALPVAIALLAFCAASAHPNIMVAQPALPKEPLVVQTLHGSVRFNVEVARTLRQQEMGLMYRKSIARFGGMIFPFQPPRKVNFWMKNTVIPLDIVFIRENGTIARIITAEPLDENLDKSGEPVAAVLEIGAGRARALGIESRNRVSWEGLPAKH